jgi:hypothetical protein
MVGRSRESYSDWTGSNFGRVHHHTEVETYPPLFVFSKKESIVHGPVIVAALGFVPTRPHPVSLYRRTKRPSVTDRQDCLATSFQQKSMIAAWVLPTCCHMNACCPCTPVLRSMAPSSRKL